MSHMLAGNRVKQHVSDTFSGTGNIILDTGIPGFQFFQVAADFQSKPVYYTIVDPVNYMWETGVGHIIIDGMGEITRDRVIQTPDWGVTDKVDFPAGPRKYCFIAPPAELLENLFHPHRNLLINGGFRYFQRQAPATATARADAAFGPDRWYCLNQTGNINVSRIAGDHTQYAGRFLQPDGTAKRYGIAQVLEAPDTIPLRGKMVRFQGYVRSSTATTMRAAIIAWTGTADTVTKDVVNDWTNGTYTPGNFFIGSNISIVNQASFSITDNFTEFGVIGEVPSNANNLFLMLWSPNTVPENSTIDFECLGLYHGSEPRIWIEPEITAELLRCQRFYTKTWPVDSVVTATGGQIINHAGWISGGTGLAYQIWRFPTRMRRTPDVTFYDGAGLVDKVSNAGSGGNQTGQLLSTTVEEAVVATDNAGTKSGIIYKALADAEL
jgi:hypothetical protein